MEIEHQPADLNRLETRTIFTEFLNLSNTFLQKPTWELSRIVKEIFYENIFLEYESINPEEYLLGIDLNNLPVKFGETLKEYLKDAINFLRLDDPQLEGVLFLLVDLLDEHGFLSETPKAIAENYNVDLQMVRKALEILKKIGPRGIASKNFLDYYSSFLEETEIMSLKKLFNGENIAHNELEKISKKFEEIPFCPASGFAEDGYRKYIVPDIILKKNQDDFIVILNEIFRLKLISIEPYRDLMEKNRNLQKEYRRALEIVKAINMRNNTLLRVAEFVVEYQKDYLLSGGEIKPLSLGIVSNNLNLSVSTISRAVKDKYMLTNKGIIELRDLFVRNVSKGKKISPDRLKKLILEITDNGKINISDSKIVLLLEKGGIKVSRRTVNKYRNILGIFKRKKRF